MQEKICKKVKKMEEKSKKSKKILWIAISLAIVALITVAPIAFVYLKDSDSPDISIILFLNMSTFVLMFSAAWACCSMPILSCFLC